MNEPSMNEIKKWKGSIEAEILRLEEEVSPALAKLAKLRERLKALETLASDDSDSQIAMSVSSKPRIALGLETQALQFAPTESYWIPILEAIVERGGREYSDAILSLVEKKMAKILTAADYEILPSGGAQRWRNRAQWQRQNMVQQGILRKDSPRGIWEITPEGRKWLAARKTDRP
jgi:restriction system protein